MLNFILWPSNIFFFALYACARKEKKIRFQLGKKVSENKGKYLSLALSKAAFPLPLLHRICLQSTMSLLGPGLVTCSLAPWHCCLLRAARDHKPGAVSAGLVLCCSS